MFWVDYSFIHFCRVVELYRALLRCGSRKTLPDFFLKGLINVGELFHSVEYFVFVAGVPVSVFVVEYFYIFF